MERTIGAYSSIFPINSFKLISFLSGMRASGGGSRATLDGSRGSSPAPSKLIGSCLSPDSAFMSKSFSREASISSSGGGNSGAEAKGSGPLEGEAMSARAGMVSESERPTLL